MDKKKGDTLKIILLYIEKERPTRGPMEKCGPFRGKERGTVA